MVLKKDDSRSSGAPDIVNASDTLFLAGLALSLRGVKHNHAMRLFCNFFTFRGYSRRFDVSNAQGCTYRRTESDDVFGDVRRISTIIKVYFNLFEALEDGSSKVHRV